MIVSVLSWNVRFVSDHHEGGQRMSGTVCDWLFEAEDVEGMEGSAHTPDHRLQDTTQCTYTFQGEHIHRVNIKLVIYGLQ